MLLFRKLRRLEVLQAIQRDGDEEVDGNDDVVVVAFFVVDPEPDADAEADAKSDKDADNEIESNDVNLGVGGGWKDCRLDRGMDYFFFCWQMRCTR